MSEIPGISEFIAQVVILRPSGGTPQEGIRNLVSALSEITTRPHNDGDSDLYLYMDLSEFNIVSSTFLGLLGSMVADEGYEYIKKVALCGASVAVKRRLMQFRLLPFDGNGSESKNRDYKIQVFTNLEEAVARTLC